MKKKSETLRPSKNEVLRPIIKASKNSPPLKRKTEPKELPSGSIP